MSAAVVLCRQAQSDRVLGITSAGNGSRVLVTVQGDGIVGYDTSRLVLVSTRALGSSQAQLLAPVQQLGSLYVAALQPHGSAHGLLVCTQAAAKQPKPLLDAEQQVALSHRLHSLHIVYIAGHRTPGCAAVVFADGSVGSADFEELCFRTCSSRLHGTASGHNTMVAAATDSSSHLLAVARQAAAGADVHVDFFAASCGGEQEPAAAARLQLTQSCTLATQTSSSRLAHISVAAGVLISVWGDGSITAYHRGADNHGKQSDVEHAAHIQVPAALAEVVAGRQQGGRKRRAAGDVASASKLLCAAVSDTQLLLVAVQSPSVARYAVLDSRYGCCLALGVLSLRDADGPAELGSSSCELLPLPAQAAAPAVLRVGGAVYLLHLQLPKADLAGLVSQLAVGPTSSTAAAANSPVTASQHINLASVMTTVAVSGQKADSSCLFQQVPADAVASTAGSTPGDHIAAAARQLAAVVARQPVPADELSQAAQDLLSMLRQPSDPDKQRKQQKPAGRKAQQQTEASQQQQPSSSSAAVLLSQLLLAQGLVALAEAGQWELLQQLHELQPLQSLAACPRLLPVIAAAQQYPLVRQVVLHAQEIPAESLNAAVRHLLLQEPSNKAARQAEAAAIRAVAAAAVQAAEMAVVAGADVAAGPLLGMACRAAAAVDGFTAGEVLLHVLLAAPVDAVEAQAALKQLETPLVLRLLRYLYKWVQKYTALPVREAPEVSSWAELGLLGSPWDSTHAQALLAVPSWAQVLEWSRLVIDAHLTSLAVLPAAAVILQRMRQTLQQEVGASSRLVALKGVADHMAMGALLPAVAEAANSQYTLELLDLRVAGRP